MWTQQPRLPRCATVPLRGVSCRACCDHGRSNFSAVVPCCWVAVWDIAVDTAAEGLTTGWWAVVWLGGLFIAQRMLFVAQEGKHRRGPIAWPGRPIYGTWRWSAYLHFLQLVFYSRKPMVTMNEARLSHLPFWGPSEGFFLINSTAVGLTRMNVRVLG